MVVKINKYTLQLDWGAFIIAAEVTGKDAVHPLQDVPNAEAYTVILYAGIARHAEVHNNAPMSYEDVKREIRSFSTYQIGELDKAWVDATSIDPDEKFPAASGKKKS